MRVHICTYMYVWVLLFEWVHGTTKGLLFLFLSHACFSLFGSVRVEYTHAASTRSSMLSSPMRSHPPPPQPPPSLHPSHALRSFVRLFGKFGSLNSLHVRSDSYYSQRFFHRALGFSLCAAWPGSAAGNSKENLYSMLPMRPNSRQSLMMPVLLVRCCAVWGFSLCRLGFFFCSCFAPRSLFDCPLSWAGKQQAPFCLPHIPYFGRLWMSVHVHVRWVGGLL
jgi:hypothetical protein